MLKLYLLLFVSTALAWLYEHTHMKINGKNKRIWLLYAILTLILICFNGLRGQYNDTWTYRDNYTYLVKPFPEVWDTFSWKLGENPAFELIQSWFKTYNVDVHLLLMFFGFWTVLFYMIFIHRHSKDLTFTVFLFFTMGAYVFTLAAIKQCMATALCLLAIKKALERKWMPFLLLVFIGSLFHPYALLFLVVPFMDFKPWGRGTYILLLCIIGGGFLFQPLLGTIVDITTAIGEEYTVSTFQGTGVGFLRILVCFVPVALSFIYRKQLFHNSSREENVFINMTMVYAGILFIGIFGTALYFGRLSNYFVMMPVITLPWIFRKINYKDARMLKLIAVPCYLFFFHISYTVENDFANAYAAISLKQYINYVIEALNSVT